MEMHYTHDESVGAVQFNPEDERRPSLSRESRYMTETGGSVSSAHNVPSGKPPSVEDMETAAEWLDCYEAAPGADDTNEAACARVASWLRSQAIAKAMRAECRKAGVPVAQLRKRLNRAAK